MYYVSYMYIKLKQLFVYSKFYSGFFQFERTFLFRWERLRYFIVAVPVPSFRLVFAKLLKVSFDFNLLYQRVVMSLIYVNIRIYTRYQDRVN